MDYFEEHQGKRVRYFLGAVSFIFYTLEEGKNDEDFNNTQGIQLS